MNLPAALPGLAKLIETVRALRDPRDGCPWDRAQTHASLKPYAIEELHEFLEALDLKGPSSPDTWEELGDVLFQVVLHSQLFFEAGYTGLDEIATRVAAKLIERHPHVFDPKAERFRTPEEVNLAWERLKSARKAARIAAGEKIPVESRADRVASVPPSLPALQRAARMGEKAASFGFDWTTSAAVLEKVHEELRELETAAPLGEDAEREEFGDLLFALAQYARKRNWDPEGLLNAANRKFVGRFRAVETLVQTSGLDWENLTMEELESHWQSAKRIKQS